MMIFLYLIVFILLIGFISFLKSPYFKGKMGEKMVTLHAERLGEEYVMLNDCTLPDGFEGNGTTQIDHVLISPYGVFIVETKNYTGWIFGGAYQKQWTQQIYAKCYRFQNPLHQNYKHQKVLEAVLADMLQPEHFYSVVVFTTNSEFKTTMPENVCRGSEWLDYVKSFQTPVLSAMKCKMVQHRIRKEVLEPGWKTNMAHVTHLKAKQQAGGLPQNTSPLDPQ